MRLNFFFALFDAGCPRGLRDTHCPIARAIMHAAAAANDDCPCRKLECRWLHEPATGKIQARWTTRD